MEELEKIEIALARGKEPVHLIDLHIADKALPNTPATETGKISYTI